MTFALCRSTRPNETLQEYSSNAYDFRYTTDLELKLAEGFPLKIESTHMAQYTGSGVLTFGGISIQSRFSADQENNGKLQIVCSQITPDKFLSLSPLFEGKQPFSFQGKTENGQIVTAACDSCNPLSRNQAGLYSLYFLPRKLCISKDSDSILLTRFTITNFLFSPFTHLGEPPPFPPSHVFALALDGHSIDIEIRPLSNYVESAVRIQQTKGIFPTAELFIKTRVETPATWISQLVSNICKLLSLAAGTVIEWIVADSDADLNGSVCRIHAARVTKPFCSFPMVPIKNFSYEANSQILQEFLQGALEESSKHDPKVIKAFIATYLDARLETDYMEARGIKLVVALEMLKNMFVDDCIRDEYQKFLPDHIQCEIAKITFKALKENGIKKDVRQAVFNNLEGLKRPSFRRVVKFMIRRLLLSGEKLNIETVVEVRNSLVHTGQFLSEEERLKPKEELPDVVGRFFALLSFIDRLVLRLLGYSGPYLNYSGSTTAHVRSTTQTISAAP